MYVGHTIGHFVKTQKQTKSPIGIFANRFIFILIRSTGSLIWPNIFHCDVMALCDGILSDALHQVIFPLHIDTTVIFE